MPCGGLPVVARPSSAELAKKLSQGDSEAKTKTVCLAGIVGEPCDQRAVDDNRIEKETLPEIRRALLTVPITAALRR